MSPIKVHKAIKDSSPKKKKKPHARSQPESVRSVREGTKGRKVSRSKADGHSSRNVVASAGASPAPRAHSTLSNRLREIREATKDVGDLVQLPTGTIHRLESGDETALLQVEQAIAMNGHSSNEEIEDRYTQAEDPTGGEFENAVSSLQQAAEASLPQQSSLKDELFREENIDMKTRLSPRLVTKLQIAEMEAREHHTPILWEFCQGIKGKRVSLLGEGRKEGVEMEKAGNIGGLSVDGFNRTKG